jgi:hypothetical protein
MDCLGRSGLRAVGPANGAAGIPTVTLGRYRRFRSDAIEDWLRELERGR